MTRKLFYLFFLFLLGACQTIEGGYLIQEKNMSLVEIRKAIQTITKDPRKVSQNNREIISQYFLAKEQPDVTVENAKERYYAHFWILGDRRPYDIRIKVLKEKRTKKGFSSAGEDKGLAKKVGIELDQRLNQLKEGHNIIDDFRPY